MKLIKEKTDDLFGHIQWWGLENNIVIMVMLGKKKKSDKKKYTIGVDHKKKDITQFVAKKMHITLSNEEVRLVSSIDCVLIEFPAYMLEEILKKIEQICLEEKF